MDSDLQQPGLSAPPALPSPPRHAIRLLVAVGTCLMLFAGSYGIVRWAMSNGHAAVDPPTNGAAPKYFVGWSKPDFVLVISGQTFGYLQPCGCSEPQYGGLARRWEFINSLKQKGWHVVPLDLGDLFPKNSDTPAQQNLLKYETSMRALHAMGYHAIGIGKQELGVPLTTALVQFSAQDNPRPRPVAANLAGVEEKGDYHALNARAYEVIEMKGLPKVGVVGMIGKTVQEALLKNGANLKFAKAQVVDALKDLAKQQTGFNVVLFQTDEKPLPGAELEVEKCIAWCVEQNQAPLHVVIHSSDDPEPPSQPSVVNGTQFITVGHKGKYVGVLGVWKTNAGHDYKYEMVLMGPELDPKAGNAVAQLLEGYTKQVMNQKLMEKYPRTPHRTQVLLRDKNIETRYIGSEICAGCHPGAHAIWSKNENHGHNVAFETLKKAEKPSLRQFDGECMQCHTTGFKHDTGFNDPNIKTKMKDKLLGVGCESCHGPSSAHANNPNNLGVRKFINPWAKQHNQGVPEHVRRQRINIFCQSCHDIENDVHWDFDKSWPKVIHMNPPPAPPKKE